MTSHEIEVDVDYHQFYLWDRSATDQAPEEYSDEDVRRMVKVAPHVVVVQPVRNNSVPATIAIEHADPGFDQDAWDHVVECSLEMPGGALEVHECLGGPVLQATVTPGTYAVRVLFAGLDTLSADGLDGEDRYTIQLWPGPAAELRVVKQWIAPSA